MKAKEIREMTAEELNAKLGDLKKDLFNLRLQHATNQLDNPKKIADVKHGHCPGQNRDSPEGEPGVRQKEVS